MRVLLSLLLLGLAAPALANDSMAELGAGGLILSRSEFVRMESEDLFISPDLVTVDYVFRNEGEEDVEAIVAFPMPDLAANPYMMQSIPFEDDDNFLGFESTVGGRPHAVQLEQRAFAVGLDVTAELEAQGVPLFPFGDDVHTALADLPDEVAADWVARGMIMIDSFDDGSGMRDERTPFWLLKSTYWWRMRFPAGEAVEVSHRYTPSVGSTAGLSFFYDGKLQGEQLGAYRARYCMDAGFEAGVLKAAQVGRDGYPDLYEKRLSYVLTTGGNWASGVIGRFRLTVDKGNARNLVSFCGTNVRKTGPTTFVMEQEDFYPARDLDILLLARAEDAPQ